MKKILPVIFAFLLAPSLFCQTASIEETQMVFRTYGYSDPDPVPRVGKIYPYYRFEGYTNDPVDKEWKIIVMENKWIKVLIAPEIGGKVLGAIEKSTGNEFLYLNKVIKFRDVAMRGAWTSGGIEFNFGSIGHAPSTSSPVNYLMQENADGSVSCFLGDMDLSSRTQWRVEVRLPNDKAWFETHANWYNPTDLSTSKYHWMNAAAEASNDLNYYWPGTHYIGHGGDAHPWPIMADGRNISRYEENDYGTYHSYHVIGEIEDYYAGYYDNKDFGFGHLTDYATKPGKKIWIWGLSRQGEIWVDLLTDPELGNIQYTEIQTGILFNQAAANSTKTPFKHLALQSHENERFTEYWFPIKETGGVTDVNEFGIVHIEDPRPRTQDPNQKEDLRPKNDSQLPTPNYHISFCPLQKIQDTILIEINDTLGIKFYADLNPLETLSITGKPIPLTNQNQYISFENQKSTDLSRTGSKIENRKSKIENLSNRPTSSPPSFDWSSLQGKYLAALEHARQRNYKEALQGFYSCLEEDQNYIPALCGAAEELIRTMKYDNAENLLQRALSVDTYHPKSNYLYGIVKKIKGEYPRAREAFGLSTRSMEFRSSGFTQLAEVALLMHDYAKAISYCSSALDYNRFNIRASQLLALTQRITNENQEALHTLEYLLTLDPLNHFARFEIYKNTNDTQALENFKNSIQAEFPEQIYLELALIYSNLKLQEDAINLLQIAPQNVLVNYLTNYLDSNPQRSKIENRKSKIENRPPTPSSFPFRPELYPAIQYAEQMAPHWQNRYYLGLMHWNFNQMTEARELFRSCMDEPDIAAFYLARSKLFKNVETELVVHDLERALDLEPDNWRTYSYLIDFYMQNQMYSEALQFARRAGKKFKNNFLIQKSLAKVELYNQNYSKCLDLLDELVILPAEGAREGHDLYRQAHLMLAIEDFKKGKTDQALEHISTARKWPENLGVGKPYVTDERIENYLEGLIQMHSGSDDRAAAAFRRVLAYTEKHKPEFDSPYLLLALSLQFLNQADQAIQMLSTWIRQKPADPVAHWATSVYANDFDAAERAISHYKDPQGGTPWNPGGGDSQFRLVYEIVNQIRLK